MRVIPISALCGEKGSGCALASFARAQPDIPENPGPIGHTFLDGSNQNKNPFPIGGKGFLENLKLKLFQHIELANAY